MRTSFDVYTEVAELTMDPTVINGRYQEQKPAEQFILPDVIGKLRITHDDTVLDIGCGGGTITLSLSCLCHKVYGVDNPVAISRISAGYVPANCSLIAGNWLDLDVSNVIHSDTVSKILIYSVVHYLKDLREFFDFVDRAVDILPENGLCLIGDIPNVDMKRRFIESSFGNEFDKKFKEAMNKKKSTSSQNNTFSSVMARDKVRKNIMFDDSVIEEIIKHYHERSCEIFQLPQPHYLPFGYTREDILIVKR